MFLYYAQAPNGRLVQKEQENNMALRMSVGGRLTLGFGLFTVMLALAVVVALQALADVNS